MEKVLPTYSTHAATAIFACNDKVSTGAYKALAEMDIKVPEEIALAGYGNLEIGQFMEVSLTSVSQSAVKIGQSASQLLLDKLYLLYPFLYYLYLSPLKNKVSFIPFRFIPLSL